MTDTELVAKKLAEIETYVRDLGRLARPEQLETDRPWPWSPSGSEGMS